MSRAYRFAVLFPAVIALLSLAFATMAAGGPCPPGDWGC
jgi:hypothetical protein